MNKSNEFMPFSSFSEFEKNDILKKNHLILSEYVLENCDDYNLLEGTIISMFEQFGFVEFYFDNNKRNQNYSLKKLGTFIFDIVSTIKTSLKLEKDNGEKRDMLLKALDICKNVSEISNHKMRFEVARFSDYHILLYDSKFYEDLYVNVDLELFNNNICLIDELSNDEGIKKSIKKIKLSTMYGGTINIDDYASLVENFSLQKIDGLIDFKNYIAENISEIEKVIQGKLAYIGSTPHLKKYLNETNHFLFNQDGEFTV
jgi:DNA polymerase III delta prime subunit